MQEHDYVTCVTEVRVKGLRLITGEPDTDVNEWTERLIVDGCVDRQGEE
jgi:hypothetical protein